MVAIALWAYVIAVVGPEYQDTFRDIPVSFVGTSALEDKGLMLLNETTPTVTLELSGNRSDLSKLNTSNISITVDLSKIEVPGKNAVLYDVAYPVNVNGSAITIKNGTPAGINLDIVRRLTKNVPIEVYYEGALPDDYIKEKPELEMEAVRISGPEDVVSKIDSARIGIQLDETSTATITGEYSFTLCDVNDAPVDAKYVQVSGENAQTISLTLPIKRVKEIPLTVTVIEGGGATVENTQIVQSMESILVSGDEAVLENLESLELGTMDLSTMLEDTRQVFDIVLPDGVANETGITQVTVSVSFEQLQTQRFYATTFQLENVPASLNITVTNVQLEVKIRGEQSLLDALQPENIIVTVDCSEATVGSNRLDAIVTIADGTKEIGAVGTYTVLAQAESAVKTATDGNE